MFEERWGLTIYDGYGQAETNIVVAHLADGASQPGSLGRALPGHHVAIIDDQGNELPAGIEGDLAVRGRPPTLFAGYWELPEETKSAFLGDWYLTGDVAHVDEEGFFTFLGRAEDVITSSGGTFGPFDVERVLTGHPAIAAAAVVGIRDLQRGGHFVRAFVVPKAGAEGSEQLEAELRQYAAQTLPDPQVPREIVFVDELPIVGPKVSRHVLRERPLAGRPLWEMPPTSEPEMEGAAPLPPPIDGEFAPRVDRGLETPQPRRAGLVARATARAPRAAAATSCRSRRPSSPSRCFPRRSPLPRRCRSQNQSPLSSVRRNRSRNRAEPPVVEAVPYRRARSPNPRSSRSRWPSREQPVAEPELEPSRSPSRSPSRARARAGVEPEVELEPAAERDAAGGAGCGGG